jgi:hypothetical protein
MNTEHDLKCYYILTVTTKAVRSQIQTPISRSRQGMSPEAPQSHERESFSQRLMFNLQNDSIPHPRQTPTRRDAGDFEYDGEREIDDEEEADAHRKEEEEKYAFNSNKG